MRRENVDMKTIALWDITARHYLAANSARRDRRRDSLISSKFYFNHHKCSLELNLKNIL
jgi:hypothetical protein